MNAQPPEDQSALAQAINELTAQITQMRTELSELQRISNLTKKTLESYYAHPQQCQEENGDTVQFKDRRDKHNPPFVPEGTQLTCVRCENKWTPHARRPKLCPQCKTPWWFPPRWKWHQSQSHFQ